MEPDLARRLAAIESLTADLLARVAARSEAEQTRRPSKNAWSPLEVIQHLVIVEERTAQQIDAADAASKPKRLGGPMIAMMAATMRAAIPVPAPPMMLPTDETIPLDTLTARWRAARDAIRERVESGAEPCVVHPLAGPLRADQCLNLLEAHLTYHLKRFPG